MEVEESFNGIILTKAEVYHRKLMVSILQNLRNTPLVLKGGTALFLGYGLTRFSEDLDFDSYAKLNLVSKLKNSIPNDIRLEKLHIKKDTLTVSRYLIEYSIPTINEKKSLKIEVSYRNPVNNEDVYVLNGNRFASVEKLIDYKLQAAYDGDTPRSKVRDFYDLHFLSFNYSDRFSQENATRLFNFSRNPDELVSKYSMSLTEDNILHGKIDLDAMALELSEQAENILKNIELKSVSNKSRKDTYFIVPLGMKYKEGKALGAQWDTSIKYWYVPAGNDLTTFYEKGWKILPDEEVNKLKSQKSILEETNKETEKKTIIVDESRGRGRK